MAGKADAAHEKERRREQTTAAEYAEMARLAAEMTPTAQEVEMMRQAQEAQQYAPTPQEIQAAQVAAAMQRDLVQAFGGDEAHWREAWGRLQPTLQTMQRAVNLALFRVRDDIEKLQNNANRWNDTVRLLGILAPYMEAEAAEHPEIYGDDEHPEAGADVPFSDLVAAAAKRARADGVEVPSLEAEKTNKEETTTEAESSPRDKIGGGPSPLVLARRAGAITTIGGRVATLADKALKDSFTSRALMGLPGKYDNFMFDSTGKLNELSLNGQPLQPLDNIHTGFLMVLLQIADNCDIREYNSNNNPEVPVYLPAFFDETGVDPRPRKKDAETKQLEKRQPFGEQAMKQLRRDRFIEFMQPLDNRVGVIDGEGYYSVARFSRYDEKSETAYIIIPYEMKLAEMAKLHADRHSAISKIFHADILTENQTAVEVANRIAVGLIERGVKRADARTYRGDDDTGRLTKVVDSYKDKDGIKHTRELHYKPEPGQTITKSKTDENGITTTISATKRRPRTFTYDTRFTHLIAECPQLAKELNEIRAAQGPQELEVIKAAKEAGREPEAAALEAARKADHKTDLQRINSKLKYVFDAAIRIILNKSDIPAYYSDMQIRTSRHDTFKAPTSSTLKDKLIIIHHGKNPAYVDPAT